MHIIPLIVRLTGEVDLESILSVEGVNQGLPLSMVLYRLILSVLEEQIQGEYPEFFQSCHADGFRMEEYGLHFKPYINRIGYLGTKWYFFIKP